MKTPAIFIIRLITLASLVALISLPAGARGPKRPPLPNGMTAPDFTADSWSGGKTHLSDYRGKIVVLDFWASWCPPCNQAMPHLQEVLSQYKKDIVLLALNVWDTSSAASTWINSHSYDFTFARDPVVDGAGSISDTYHVWGIPTTYVIDPSGKIAASEVVMSEDDLVSAIRALGARTLDEHAQADAAEAAKDELADTDGVRPDEILLSGTVEKTYSGDAPLLLSATSFHFCGKQVVTFKKPRMKTVIISPSTHLRGEAADDAKPLRFEAGEQIEIIGQDEGVGEPLMARMIVLPKPAK